MEPTNGGLKLNFDQDVDCVAVTNIGGEEILCAGLSNFYGPYWTGGLVFTRTSQQSPPITQKQLRTGVSSVAWFHEQDQSVGQHVLVSAGDDGAIDLWGIQLMDNFQTKQKNKQDDNNNGNNIENILAQHLTNKVAHGHVISALSIPEQNGKQNVVSTSYDGFVKLWDSQSGLKCVSSLVIPFARILAMCSRGNTCIVAGEDNFTRLWDLREKNWAQKIQTSFPVQSLDFRNQTVVTSDQCGFSHLLDLRNLQTSLCSGQLHGGKLSSDVEIHSNVKTFASCGDDGRVAVIDQFFAEKETEIQYKFSDIEYFQDEPLWPINTVCWGITDKGESTDVLYKAGTDKTIASHKVILYQTS